MLKYGAILTDSELPFSNEIAGLKYLEKASYRQPSVGVVPLQNVSASERDATHSAPAHHKVYKELIFDDKVDEDFEEANVYLKRRGRIKRHNIFTTVHTL